MVIVFLALALPLWVSGVPHAHADTSGKLAFTANLDGNWDLFIANADGSSLVRLTKTPFDERTPAWSPNRKWIVYSTSDGALRIMDIGTEESTILPLEEIKGGHVQPCFSPNGKEIVYVSVTTYRIGSRQLDDANLVIFNMQTGKSHIFLAQRVPQFTPAWSPDGKSIVYASTHGSLECGRMIQELWIAQTLRQEARQLLLTNSHCMQPTWSPDGTKIAFASDKSGNFDIWIYDCKTGVLKQMTTNPALDVNPAWSPDGKRIAFISARSGKAKIWIKTLESREYNGQKSGTLTKFNPFSNQDVEYRNLSWR